MRPCKSDCPFQLLEMGKQYQHHRQGAQNIHSLNHIHLGMAISLDQKPIDEQIIFQRFPIWEFFLNFIPK
ncbi:protein of unknown function [Methanoculleus bourgensis]|uniref:Uncharacterized protein n=1 Tax=Methanoculleus bourgensis TaxID=83986 RepID=A0A0X3BJW8_9EURY|nr:protein of unknown function [Methanoculleus bourgensis]